MTQKTILLIMLIMCLSALLALNKLPIELYFPLISSIIGYVIGDKTGYKRATKDEMNVIPFTKKIKK